ncbi:MAG TPA: tRNA (adenosine(37)-N6)-threonylcarbamoyltransferase complex ATPase subunit type 1 TsaE [Bacteroidota bacterium]|nr:tRNA (adenosine(37)-N6)-threonylcarbamoyltransferase complex ATPase subunit type 1 TsaE [Bacteroidota bacterium]
MFHSKSPGETLDIASSFAASLKRNEIVALVGELGSGKTQFVKGICRHFKVREQVSSPTFVMLHRYDGLDAFQKEILLYHFDLYKVKSPAEVFDLGYEEFFRGNGICMIEWAELLGELMPFSRTEIRLSFGADERERRIEVDRSRRVSPGGALA